MSVTPHPTTEEALNAALEAGRDRRQTERRAGSVRYNARKDAVEIELTDGAAVRIPRKMIAELRDIPRADMRGLRVSPVGYAIKLDAHDIGISVHGLMAALAAPSDMAASLGRLGGLVRSEKKRESARANGAKGGRPRKVVQAA
jgi:hypothetical protein